MKTRAAPDLEAARPKAGEEALALGRLLQARGDFDGAEAAFIRAKPGDNADAAEALDVLRAERQAGA